ncbi:MAG: hypothetical protein II055_03790 [Prevotella sp.]|nr:hypothetical protein [Prevotella sp.]
MKKLFLLMCLMATTVIASATDVWTGEQVVSWDNTLKIEATQFADMKVGDKIVIEFKDAGTPDKSKIELHSNFVMLPGTRCEQTIIGQGEIEVFSTPTMLASLKEYGLELCGDQYTATKIWYGDGKESIDDLTVWSGFFWMDEWCTLEITKNCFVGVDWSKIKAIRFYSEANRTDYVINILTKWGEGGKLGDHTTMTMTNEYAELSLDDIDMETALADVDRLMIQCNKEGGAPFNFTQVELVSDGTAVQNVAAKQNIAAGQKIDLQGRIVAQPVKGSVIIVDGKKVIAE